VYSNINLRMKKFRFVTLGPFVVLVVLFIFTALISSNFLSVENLTNIMRQASINAALAVGLTFVILTGGIDLSVGAVIAISGIIAAKFSMLPPIVSIVAPFGAGIIAGLLNGVMVSKMKIAPFIATLSTMLGVRGVAYLLVETSSVSVERTSDAFMYIAKGDILGIPFPSIIIILLFLVAGFILKYTAFGRNIYSVGGNEEAANMMGVNCDRVKIGAYVVCGVCASLSGLILTARLGTALPGAGVGYELKAISTVVLGGIYLTGGRGSILGAFWATLTMGLITNMFNMAGNLSTWLENLLMGLLLLVIVLVQSPELKEMVKKEKKSLKASPSLK